MWRQVKKCLFIFLTNYQRLRTHRDETISAWSFLKDNMDKSKKARKGKCRLSWCSSSTDCRPVRRRARLSPKVAARSQPADLRSQNLPSSPLSSVLFCPRPLLLIPAFPSYRLSHPKPGFFLAFWCIWPIHFCLRRWSYHISDLRGICLKWSNQARLYDLGCSSHPLTSTSVLQSPANISLRWP